MPEDTEQPLTDLRQTLETSLGDSYAFERELGGGGMSRVFLAQDRTLQRLVVVKVLKPDLAAGMSFDRFRREIQLAAKLQHPHIVPLLASGEVAGTPYFTMPFIDGESLRARLARDHELPVSDAMRVLRHVVSALSYAHKHNVVHRDIKPDNVMLSDEFALVTDFGVAKALSVSADSGTDVTLSGLTGMGLAIGTPAYMAPEQAVADPTVDHRADIYSCGILAYEMLTGSPPFSGMTAQATLAAQAIETPVPIQTKRPMLPGALSALIMRCLEKRPGDRPQTASELLQELDAIASGTIATLPGLVPPPRRQGMPRLAIAAIALLVLLPFGYWLSQRRGPGPPAGAQAELSSVAVLPLVNVGGDTANDYFSDGMTDELANALGKLPGLRVASRTSTYAFKGKTGTNVGDIGRALHVQAVLEGTVRRAGERLRVSAQLTNVSDGLALWSDTYERQAKDVFEVQDDIARSISDALKLKLGAQASTVASTSHGTDNLQAYDLYLRGIYFWNARGDANLRRSISYFEQAVATDPRFGRAYAALASAYALLPEYTDSPPADVLARTQNASNRALAIDSTLAQAHTALGLASVHAWDYETARHQYEMAIASDPRYPTAHQWYGEFLYRTNQVDSAIVEIGKARALDPLSPIITGAMGLALNLAGRYGECITEMKKGIELAPGIGLLQVMIAQCYAYAGDFPRAIRSAELGASADKGLAMREGQLAYVYGVVGEKAKAAALAEKLTVRARTPPGQWFPVALAEIGIGNKAEALTALEKAVAAHEIGLAEVSLVSDKMWDSVWADPRFQRILEQTNLARYAQPRRR